MASSPPMYSRVEEDHGTLNTLTKSSANLWATLSSSPKSLHTVWLEYQHGLGGKKSVKMFTSGERSGVKQKYCMSKPFWQLISKNLHRRFIAQIAIDATMEV